MARRATTHKDQLDLDRHAKLIVVGDPPPAPSTPRSLTRAEAEASRDAGIELRRIALTLPAESSRRAEMLEDAADYLAHARLHGVYVPALEAVREAQRQSG